MVQLKARLYPEHDYSLRPQDSVPQSVQTVFSSAAPGVIDKLVSGQEELPVGSEGHTDVPAALQQQYQDALGLLDEQRYREYLEHVPYQTICQTLAFVDHKRLGELEQLLREPSEALKGRGKLFLVAVGNRVHELVTDPEVSVGRATKHFSRSQLEIQDALGPSYAWQGEVRRLEAQKFNHEMYVTVGKIVKALQTKTPTFLMSGRIRHYERNDVFQIMTYLGRVLNCYYTVYVVGSGQTPDEIEDELTHYLMHNYIILVCGLEFVPLDTIVKILFVSTSFMHKTGRFQGTNKFGGLIFFLPILCHNENSVKLTTDAEKILETFYQREEIIFHSNIEEEYAQQTTYSKEIAEMAKFISCLEYQYPNVMPQDIPFILARVQDQNDPVQVVNSIYASLSHQCQEKVASSIKELVAGCFNIDVQLVHDSIDGFKQPQQYPTFSRDGNFTFELLQFYVRQSMTALVGRSQQLSQLLASFLAKTNGWKLYWITSLRDLEEEIHEIEKDPENVLLVFCFQQIEEKMAHSMYKTILQLQIPHQPLELNHKYHFAQGIKTLVIMNEFEQADVMNTPLALIQHRILVSPDLLNLEYSINHAILNRVQLRYEKPKVQV